MSSTEDDQKLIQIVEYHQVLWDNRIKGYRDKKQTQHAWASVAEVLERDVSDVMARWASLRKQYSRKVCQLRQKTGLESPETTWPLFSNFSFLKPCITARKHVLNIPQINPTSQQPSYTSANNYTSTEDLSSSSMSDGSSEVSPHLIRVNPTDKTAESDVSEKKQIKMIKPFGSRFTYTSTIKKNLRSFANKSREQNKVPPVTSTTKTSSIIPNSNTQHKEQSDNESLCSTVAKVSRPPGPKSASSISKSLSVDVKPAIVKPSELKVKKLKVSADSGYCSSVSKVTNGVSDTGRSKDNNSKACDSKQYDSKGCDSKGCDSKGCDSKGYDADEYFLLSLAPDLRKLSARQKYEVKSKMLDIVSEQYLMN